MTPTNGKQHSTAQVSATTGVPVSTLNGWVRAGWLKPSIRSSLKQGSRAVWSSSDLAVVRQLREAQALAARVASASELLRRCAADQVVAVGPGRSAVLRRDETIQDLLRRAGSPCAILVRPADAKAS